MAARRAGMLLLPLLLAASLAGTEARVVKQEVDHSRILVQLHDHVAGPAAAEALVGTAAAATPAAARAAAAASVAAASAAAARFAAAALDSGVELAEPSRALGYVMTGVAMVVRSADDAARLRASLQGDPAVKAVHPVARLYTDIYSGAGGAAGSSGASGSGADDAAVATAAAAEPSIWGGVDRDTRVELAWNAGGADGGGVRVAVIDDGVDFTHPAFGCTSLGQPRATCRVVAGHDFVDDDDRPYSGCGGHGTHVAGIVGGDMAPNGTAVAWRGVAFRASIGAYRVFDCVGSVTLDRLLAAIDMAVKDEMDVVNLSLGTSWASPLPGLEPFAERLARFGIAVIAAAGNDGSDGLWTQGYPGADAAAFAIGSTDNKLSLGAALTLRSSNATTTSAQRKGSLHTVDATARVFVTEPMFALPAELALPVPADACDNNVTNAGDIKGKVVLVSPGNCSEHHKAAVLLQAGARSVLFYSSKPGAFKSILSVDADAAGEGRRAPQMFATTNEAGSALALALQRGERISVTRVATRAYPLPTGGALSSFSSAGPDWRLSRLVPAFVAPGGSILSSVPGGMLEPMMGTSMATPYASGAYALWLQARRSRAAAAAQPQLSAPPALAGRALVEAARAAFINTAAPVMVQASNTSSGKFAASVAAAGAGLVQVAGAIAGDVSASPAVLLPRTGLAAPPPLRLTLSNAGAADVTYALSHQPAQAVAIEGAWYGAEPARDLASDVSFYAVAAADGSGSSGSQQQQQQQRQRVATVTVPARGAASVDVAWALPAELAAAPHLYSGYVLLQPVVPAAAGRSSSSSSSSATQLPVPRISVPYLSASTPFGEMQVLAGPEPASAAAARAAAAAAAGANGEAAARAGASANASATAAADNSLPRAAPAPRLCNLGLCTEAEADGAHDATVSADALASGAISVGVALVRPVAAAWLEVRDAASGRVLGRTSGAMPGPIGWAGPRSFLQLPDSATNDVWNGTIVPAPGVSIGGSGSSSSGGSSGGRRSGRDSRRSGRGGRSSSGGSAAREGQEQDGAAVPLPPGAYRFSVLLQKPVAAGDAGPLGSALAGGFIEGDVAAVAARPEDVPAGYLSRFDVMGTLTVTAGKAAAASGTKA